MKTLRSTKSRVFSAPNTTRISPSHSFCLVSWLLSPQATYRFPIHTQNQYPSLGCGRNYRCCFLLLSDWSLFTLPFFRSLNAWKGCEILLSLCSFSLVSSLCVLNNAHKRTFCVASRSLKTHLLTDRPFYRSEHEALKDEALNMWPAATSAHEMNSDLCVREKWGEYPCSVIMVYTKVGKVLFWCRVFLSVMLLKMLM